MRVCGKLCNTKVNALIRVSPMDGIVDDGPQVFLSVCFVDLMMVTIG